MITVVVDVCTGCFEDKRASRSLSSTVVVGVAARERLLQTVPNSASVFSFGTKLNPNKLQFQQSLQNPKTDQRGLDPRLHQLVSSFFVSFGLDTSPTSMQNMKNIGKCDITNANTTNATVLHLVIE